MRRKSFLSTLLLISTLIISPVIQAEQTSNPIQQLIDAAQPGETIIIPSGQYEGTIVVEKKLTIMADHNVTITNDSVNPTIHVKADGVTIRGLTINDKGVKETGAIFVEGDHSLIEDIHIQATSDSFKLVGANHNELRNNTITSTLKNESNESLSERPNGIDLYESNNNRIIGNQISEMHDGIYLERSHRTIVEDNKVDRSRYGIHCMYTDETVIRNNIGSFNITGAMVMAVQDVEVVGNTFYKQSENVHSQGILLFDAHSSTFTDNKVMDNRVGFYVEQSNDNTIVRNEMKSNFVGIQIIKAENNSINENVFSGNVIAAEAIKSNQNDVKGNYWDTFNGLDTNGDGYSDLKNTTNPFFQTMIENIPAYQLFFQSPGMLFLEGLFQSEEQTSLTDYSPLITPPSAFVGKDDHQINVPLGISGIILLLLSIIIILKSGVRRR